MMLDQQGRAGGHPTCGGVLASDSHQERVMRQSIPGHAGLTRKEAVSPQLSGEGDMGAGVQGCSRPQF